MQLTANPFATTPVPQAPIPRPTQAPAQQAQSIQQPTQQSSGGLDPQVVNLAKAIRQTESGGDFNARGKSGEIGAYQFEPTTFAAASQKYLGQSVPLAQATPQQQNEVAYKQIADWKNQGYNVGQIASMWNAGPGKPNAYLTGNSGTNSYGASYDTAAYAKKVATYYQQFKAQGQNTPETNTPQQSTLDKASNIVGAVFPGQQIGKAIGTGLGYLETKIGDIMNGTNNAQYYDTSIPSALQLAGDVGQIGLTAVGGVAPELAEAGKAAEGATSVIDAARAADLAKNADYIATAGGIAAGGSPEAAAALQSAPKVSTLGKIATYLGGADSTLGKIGGNAALGAGFGLTGALANGQTSPGAIAGQTAFGGALGGAAGVVGETLSNFADKMPSRIVNNLLPQLKQGETLDYAIDHVKLGSVDSMVQASTKALNSYDTAIDSVLTHPDYANVVVPGDAVVEKTLAQFPNSEYTPDSIYAKIKSQIPGEAGLVTKLQNGSLSLDEANTLRQALDRASYKTAIDSPEVKAGKEITSAMGNVLRNTVKTEAPETAAIFDNYSKEINVNKALKKLQLKRAKAGAISFKELLGAVGATGAFGPIGGATALGLEKAADTPAVALGTAKAVKAVTPLIKGVATIGKLGGALAGKTPIN